MYDDLREKFKPWVCLRELDIAATVSLCGCEVIRKIEFHKEEKMKYARGLFQSRFQLSRLARKLEMHAKSILPFELTPNSVKFNIPVAVKWLMEKHGLWKYVLDGNCRIFSHRKLNKCVGCHLYLTILKIQGYNRWGSC